MTLRACRTNKGLKKRINRLILRQNRAVYSGFTLSDLFGRLRAFLKFTLFTLLNQLTYFVCLSTRLIFLLKKWRRSLLNFCPDKEDFTAGTPLVVGHRGTPLKAVENTIEACQIAMEKLHAEAVEIDLCVTGDDQVILWHDWDPKHIQAIVRQAGLEPHVRYRPYVPTDEYWLKRTSQLTLDEFRSHFNYSRKHGPYKSCGAHIPVLEEFFLWASGQSELKCVFLDVKVPSAEKEKALIIVNETARLVEKYAPVFKIVFLTPEEDVLMLMRRAYPHFNYSLDIVLPLILVLDTQDFSAVAPARRLGNRYASVGRPTALDIAPWATYRQIIAYDRRLMMESSSEYPRELVAWTINKRREMKCLKNMGVSAILTDRPKILAKLNGAFGGGVHRIWQKTFRQKQS